MVQFFIVSATRLGLEMQRKAKTEIDHPAEDGTKALEQSVMGDRHGERVWSCLAFVVHPRNPGAGAGPCRLNRKPVAATCPGMVEGRRSMGTATNGTWWLAGGETHADPLFFGTQMAHGSWCTGMGTGSWMFGLLGPSGLLLELLGA